jgi:hypothetical protein
MDARHPEHIEPGGSCAGPAGAAEKADELELFDPVEIVLVLIIVPEEGLLVVDVEVHVRVIVGPQRAARLVGALEALHELVPFVLVDGDFVGDKYPLIRVELVHLKELMIDLGGVVDDDHDLGLRVEIAPGTQGELIEGEAAGVGHGAFIPD